MVLGRQDDRRLTVSENLPALNDPRAEDPSAGNFSSYTFTFDHVYSEDSDQQRCARLVRVSDCGYFSGFFGCQS